MPKAPATNRATDHVNLSFGLVNIPVSVYTGTVSTHGITRNEFVNVPATEVVLGTTGEVLLDRTGDVIRLPKTEEFIEDDGTITERPVFEAHPVGRGSINKATGDLLEPGADVVKKIQTEYGPVYVEDDEIEKLFEISPKSIVIKKFQPRHVYDQGNYLVKGLYFLEATALKVGTKKQPNKAAETSLSLILTAMQEENAIAVVEFTTRGIPKPALLFPDGSLLMVWHTDAVRERRPLATVDLDPAVVAQGRMLIKTAWSEDPLDLSDKRSELIQAFADEKAAAGDFGKPDTEAEPVVAQPAGGDLMALLQASVDAAQAQQSAAV